MNLSQNCKESILSKSIRHLHQLNHPNIDQKDQTSIDKFQKISNKHSIDQDSENKTVKKACYQSALFRIIQEQLSIKENIKVIQSNLFSKIDEHQKKDYIYHVYRGATYALQKLKSPSQQFVTSKQLILKNSSSHKKMLILGLNGVLIYTEKEMQQKEKNPKYIYKFMYRPHLFTFLEKMSEVFDIYLFAQTEKSYNDEIVKKLNKSKVFIKEILCKEHCFKTKRGKYIKDLRIIKNKDLKDIIIIDNSVEAFGLQISNGIPLLQFKGASEDNQLLEIIPFLQNLSKADDVRVTLQQRFGLSKLGNIDWSKVLKHFQFDCI